MTTGEMIRYLRKRRGLTGQEIFLQGGPDSATLSRYEKDLREPTRQSAMSLARIFRLSGSQHDRFLMALGVAPPHLCNQAIADLIEEEDELVIFEQSRPSHTTGVE